MCYTVTVLMPLAGLEPATYGSEPHALSVELQGHNIQNNRTM